MDLETRIEVQNAPKLKGTNNYLPFGMRYLENPKPRGYTPSDTVYGFTSVTFSTFKGVPLIDDPD